MCFTPAFSHICEISLFHQIIILKLSVNMNIVLKYNDARFHGYADFHCWLQEYEKKTNRTYIAAKKTECFKSHACITEILSSFKDEGKLKIYWLYHGFGRKCCFSCSGAPFIVLDTEMYCTGETEFESEGSERFVSQETILVREADVSKRNNTNSAIYVKKIIVFDKYSITMDMNEDEMVNKLTAEINSLLSSQIELEDNNEFCHIEYVVFFPTTNASYSTLKFSANLNFMFSKHSSIQEKYFHTQKVGFKGIECGDVYSYPVEQLIELKKETKLEQVLLNAYTGDTKGMAALPHQVEEFRNSLEISIQYCNAMKCKRLHIMAGQFPIGVEITEEFRDSFTSTFIKNLRYSSERLEKENITAFIEPISTIPNYFLTSTYQALDILKCVDRSNVMLQLDLYHHQRTHGNIVETLNAHLSSIGHIQIAQVPGRTEPNEEGEINYPFIFKHLMKIGYKGWIGCEYVESDTSHDFGWLGHIL